VPDRPDYSVSSAPSPLRSDATGRLHIIALLTTLATFPLIFMGGLVTSHHAGMSVPDWPNSYGYNMFLFPPSKWAGGIFYEHTHRLAGTVVGFCSVVLTLYAWRAPEPRRWVRWLATAVLGTVLFQGLLGGLRVVLVNLDLAIVHACLAQAFFCLAAFTAIVTSRWWFAAGAHAVGSAMRTASGASKEVPSWASKEGHGPWASTEGPRGGPYNAHQDNARRRLVILAILTVLVIYLQLIVGATMRHFDAGLAIPDLPLAYGKLLPPTSQDALAAINHHRAFDLQLDHVTLAQVWVHFAHRIGALLVSVLVLTLTSSIFRRHRRGGLLFPAIVLLTLLCAQITLGTLTVLLRKPADVASAHVAIGALVLASSFWLAVRALRLYRPQWRLSSPASSAEEVSRDRAASLVTT
jgi:heme a synthase